MEFQLLAAKNLTTSPAHVLYAPNDLRRANLSPEAKCCEQLAGI